MANTMTIQRCSKVTYQGATYRVYWARGKQADIYLDGAVPVAKNRIMVAKTELTLITE